MTPGLILLLLGAAALHAAWNAIVKAAPEQRTEVILVAVAAALIAGSALPFLPVPALAAWPYLAASVLLQFAYFQLLGLIYRFGELSYVYPLMRGTAPLVTALAGAVAIGEHLGGGGWAGVLLLSCGVLLLGIDSWRSRPMRWRVTGFGVLNACVIAGYTIVDGLGIRVSTTPWSYIAWLFFLNSAPLLLQNVQQVQGLVQYAAARWRTVLLCGLFMIVSYSVALWAMTLAPLAMVAALRETSVLFATAFAAVFLRERFGLARYLAAALVTAGAVAMKLG
jgi:drug/metabolite transporter (DMT)-like permease